MSDTSALKAARKVPNPQKMRLAFHRHRLASNMLGKIALTWDQFAAVVTPEDFEDAE